MAPEDDDTRTMPLSTTGRYPPPFLTQDRRFNKLYSTSWHRSETCGKIDGAFFCVSFLPSWTRSCVVVPAGGVNEINPSNVGTTVHVPLVGSASQRKSSNARQSGGRTRRQFVQHDVLGGEKKEGGDNQASHDQPPPSPTTICYSNKRENNNRHANAAVTTVKPVVENSTSNNISWSI